MDQSTKPNLTFINLSHPDDLKDRETIDQIRCSAMTNFGRMRKKRRPKRERNEIVFEVRPPEAVLPSTSNRGSDDFNPLAFSHIEMNDYESRLFVEGESWGFRCLSEMLVFDDVASAEQVRSE
jgi:hypothetical protein